MPGTADKGSVDSRASGFEWACGQSGTTATAISYIPLGDVGAYYSNATETNVDRVISAAFRITRLRAWTIGNTRTVDIILGFRDDAATAVSLTITAGAASTEFDSGVLSVIVAAGSKCDFIRDLSAGTGSLTFNLVVECEWL